MGKLKSDLSQKKTDETRAFCWLVVCGMHVQRQKHVVRPRKPGQCSKHWVGSRDADSTKLGNNTLKTVASFNHLKLHAAPINVIVNMAAGCTPNSTN